MEAPVYLVGFEGQRQLEDLPAKQQEKVADAAKQAAKAFVAGLGEYSVPRALAGSINASDELAAVCTELASVVALRAVSDAFSKSTMLEAFFSDRFECYSKLEARGSGYSGAPSTIDEPLPLKYGRFSDRPADIGKLTAAAAVEHGRRLGKALVELLRAVPSTLQAGGAFHQLFLAVVGIVVKSKSRAATQQLPRIAHSERNGIVAHVPQARGLDPASVAYMALTPLFETWLWLFGRFGTGGAERNQCGPANEIAARALDLASGGARKESASVVIAEYMAPAFATVVASNKNAARVFEALVKAVGSEAPPEFSDVPANAPPRPDSPSERVANAVAAIFVQGCEDLVARYGAHLQKEAALLLNVCRDPRLADRIRRLIAEIAKVGKDRVKQWKKTADRLYPTGACGRDGSMATVIEFEDEDDIVEHMFAATDAKKSDKAAAAFAAAFADTLGAYCIPRANAADAQSASGRGLAASAPALYGLATELVGLVALDYVARHGAAAQLDSFYGTRLAQFYQHDRQGQVGRDRSDQFDYFRNLRHEVPLDKPRFKKGGKLPVVDGKLARSHGERLGKALLALLKSSDFKKVQSTLYADVVAELAKNVAVHADATYALPNPSGPLSSRESQIAAALLDTLFEVYVAYFARSAAPPAREAVKDKWSRDHASTEMFARYLQLLVGGRSSNNNTDPDSLKRLAKRIGSSKNKAVVAITAELLGEFPNMSPDEPLPKPSAGFPSVPYSSTIEDLVFEGYALACEALDADMRAAKFDAKKRSNVVRYVRGGLIAATPFDARLDQLEKLLRNPGMMAPTKCGYDDYDEFERAGYEMAMYVMEETGKKKSKSQKLEEKARHERHKEHEKAKKDYDRAKRAMKKTKAMVDGVMLASGAWKHGWTYEEDGRNEGASEEERFPVILSAYGVSDEAIAALERHNVRTLSDLADVFENRTVGLDPNVRKQIHAIVGDNKDAFYLTEVYQAYKNGYFDDHYL